MFEYTIEKLGDFAQKQIPRSLYIKRFEKVLVPANKLAGVVTKKRVPLQSHSEETEKGFLVNYCGIAVNLKEKEAIVLLADDKNAFFVSNLFAVYRTGTVEEAIVSSWWVEQFLKANITFGTKIDNILIPAVWKKKDNKLFPILESYLEVEESIQEASLELLARMGELKQKMFLETIIKDESE